MDKDKMGKLLENVKNIIKDNWLSATITIVLIILINFILMANQVVGNSMYPTLHDGQRLLSLKVGLNPKRGDVVMIHSSALGEDIVKRVVAIPGDSVVYADGMLMVNDAIVDEDYINREEVVIDTPDISITKLGDDEYFVLGDNRNHSSDSRSFGTIKHEEIFGILLLELF